MHCLCVYPGCHFILIGTEVVNWLQSTLKNPGLESSGHINPKNLTPQESGSLSRQFLSTTKRAIKLKSYNRDSGVQNFKIALLLMAWLAGGRADRIVLPESTVSFEFTHPPDWVALSDVGETSGIFSRFSNRPSGNVSLSLKITSRSFWRQYKIVKTRTVISASMIQSASSNI